MKDKNHHSDEYNKNKAKRRYRLKQAETRVLEGEYSEIIGDKFANKLKPPKEFFGYENGDSAHQARQRARRKTGRIDQLSHDIEQKRR